jgi:hypothetical protein
MHNSPRLVATFERQLVLIKKGIATLHEDLQYDYQIELDNLMEK